MYDIVVCTCGKSLRAYEGMAEIYCPVCRQSIQVASPAAGIPVVRPTDEANRAPEITLFGIDPPAPSMQPAPLQYQVVEISSEMTPPRPANKDRRDEDDSRPYPIERPNQDREAGKTLEEMWGPNVVLTPDINSPLPSLKKQRRPRRPDEWRLEQHWYECLAYPVRGWPLIAALGLCLTIAVFGLLQVLRDDGVNAWFFYVLGGVTLAYTCGFLTCVLNAGAAGVWTDVHWPGANVRILGESLLAGFLSFLAGPIIPASLGVYFWIYSGDLAWIDILILFELMFATVGYWLLVFLSAALSDTWKALLPGVVIQNARRLGVGTTCLALGIVIGVFLFHSVLALAGVETPSVGSFILLLLCWMSLLYWLVFLMRWLGLCVYRLKLAARRAR